MGTSFSKENKVIEGQSTNSSREVSKPVNPSSQPVNPVNPTGSNRPQSIVDQINTIKNDSNISTQVKKYKLQAIKEAQTTNSDKQIVENELLALSKVGGSRKKKIKRVKRNKTNKYKKSKH